MKLSKFFTTAAMISLTSASAMAFWGHAYNSNGPYTVMKYATSVTCKELHEMIHEEGGMVVWESANPAIYELRVANVSFCPTGERVKMDWVKTADGQCKVKGCEANPSAGEH